MFLILLFYKIIWGVFILTLLWKYELKSSGPDIFDWEIFNCCCHCIRGLFMLLLWSQCVTLVNIMYQENYLLLLVFPVKWSIVFFATCSRILLISLVAVVITPFSIYFDCFLILLIRIRFFSIILILSKNKLFVTLNFCMGISVSILFISALILKISCWLFLSDDIS